MSIDKPTLNQIYIAGGHLGGGGGAGNDGSDEGQRRQAGAAGRHAAGSAATAAVGVALEKRRRSAGGLALAVCYYLLTYCVKERAPQKCSAYLVAPGSTFFCSREHFFAIFALVLIIPPVRQRKKVPPSTCSGCL
jgi:hypothetical protein